MRLDRYDSVEAFLDRAGAFLEAREAEHNLLFGICSTLRQQPDIWEGPNYLAVVESDGSTVAAALRTPPHNVVLSMVDRPEAVDRIADDTVAAYGDLPGVLGDPDAARRFAERVSAHLGRGHRRAIAERIFRLERVVPPRPASGRMRAVEPRDRQLLIDWLTAFVVEALGPEEDTSNAEMYADRWIAGQHRTMYLWEDGGRAVSMAGAGGETPNGIRIGPVYTPPKARGRGYASNLTAQVSQAQLDAGRRFCFLFTDLANPTSNRIYRSIGYEPVVDVDQYRFDSPR